MNKQCALLAAVFMFSAPAFAAQKEARQPAGSVSFQCGIVTSIETRPDGSGDPYRMEMIYLDSDKAHEHPAVAFGVSADLAHAAFISGATLCVCKVGQAEIFRIAKAEDEAKNFRANNCNAH